MHGQALFFWVFGVIFVAELPDKTALAALVLATRHRPLPVLLGAATALTIQSLVAVQRGGARCSFALCHTARHSGRRASSPWSCSLSHLFESRRVG